MDKKKDKKSIMNLLKLKKDSEGSSCGCSFIIEEPSDIKEKKEKDMKDDKKVRTNNNTCGC